MSNCQPCQLKPENPKRKAFLRTKAFILDRLGNKCAHCDQTRGLHMDCIIPRGKEHHGKSLYDRMRFYMLEFSRANLQLLCPKCHSAKSTDDKNRMNFAQMARRIAENEAESATFRQHMEEWTKPRPPVAMPLRTETWEEKCERHRRMFGIK